MKHSLKSFSLFTLIPWGTKLLYVKYILRSTRFQGFINQCPPSRWKFVPIRLTDKSRLKLHHCDFRWRYVTSSYGKKPVIYILSESFSNHHCQLWMTETHYTTPCSKLILQHTWHMFNPVARCCSGADNYKNRSNYDTTNRFGTNTLWGSLFKKITRATQNFNMAAIFLDDCHGASWNVIFCLKMAVNGQKRLLWQYYVCFDHAKCTLNVINTNQMFRLFQYGSQFPRWPPWAIA